MAEFIDEVSDSVAANDELHVALNGELQLDALVDSVEVTEELALAVELVNEVQVVLSDDIGADDRAPTELEAERVFLDELLIDDEVTAFVTREVDVTIADTLTVADDLSLQIARTSQISDSVVVGDVLLVAVELERQHADTAAVSDSLAVGATISLLIDDVIALTPTRVRIVFERPALINDALTRTSSYVFNNVSAGTVEVVPLSVNLPPGQPEPLFVEIDTTEHTNGGTYEVALTEAIRGAAGEIGYTVPVPYIGLGVAPTLQLALAISSTEVQVHFSEAIANEADANDKRNYNWDNGLQTIAVRSVVGNVVNLQTTAQVPGQLYTLTVTARPPNIEVVIDDDPIEADGDLFVELISFDVVMNDDVDVDDSIEAEFPPQQLLMIVGRYLAPSDESGVQTSVDGISWAAASGFAGDGFGLQRAAYGNGVNVVTGNSIVYVSDGHGVWTLIGIGGDNALGICFSPELGIFVMGGHNGFSVSSDGVSWTFYPADVSPFDCYFWSVAWSPELGLFVAGGNDADLIQTSPDGQNWTRHAQGGGFFGLWWGLAWNPGAGLFVAAGGNSAAPDALQTSPDGVNWTVRTPGSGYSGQWLSAAASATRFVVTGWAEGTPEVQTSDDGITWTRRTLANFYLGLPYGVTYRADLGLFVLCGDGAEIQTSPDGVAWTHRTPGGGVTDALFRGVG